MALFNGNNMKKDITGEILLEQWGKCVDMANSISDKRINSNGIFLALESALVALITFTFDAKSLILSVLGICVSVYWYFSICAYKRLNSVKYEIINAIEDKLPVAPFREEWERLKHKKKNGKIKVPSLSGYEKALPIIFGLIFLACIIAAYSCSQELGGLYAECIHSTSLE